MFIISQVKKEKYQFHFNSWRCSVQKKLLYLQDPKIWKVWIMKRRYIFDEVYIAEEDYPFSIKTNFATLGSILEIEPGRGWQISFVQNDTLRDLLGFKPVVICDEYKLSHNPIDILSFDSNFLETDIAQGMTFKG